MGFGCLGFKGLGFRVLYLWFEVYRFGGLDFRVWDLGFEVWVFRVLGLWLGLRVQGFGIRI